MASASFATYITNPYKPTKDFKSLTIPISQNPLKLTQTRKQFSGAVKAAVKTTGNELDLIPVLSNDTTDHQVGNLVTENEVGGGDNEGGCHLKVDLVVVVVVVPVVVGEGEDVDKLMDRVINASIVLAAGTFGITKLLTIDYDYWHLFKGVWGCLSKLLKCFCDYLLVKEKRTAQSCFSKLLIPLTSNNKHPFKKNLEGWTIFEILRYAPQHNWSAYEEALKENPLLAKMMISGVVYSIGDWIAQCCEGKPLLEFDRTRMFRSGLVGFSLHGSLSHYYYYFCEALFPFQDWWVVPVKVTFDQTAWAAVWNSIYFVVVGLLRFESPVTIFSELKATFWPMLTAGWKLWPFAHIITYGVVPIEQRLLWVDCVELIWVTILSTLSNEKSEARILDAPADLNAISSSESPEV
ncbi:peroxisomal membrane 22 kDa (Mpv17/PMP22) family protein [Artemisia annua]|uniref:Peroxisomal membrane 22 kDa (Mpv17/PMP22) family protein n=1 Tax=Artemisia annua TaxID=35608 RepID=A0A2U1LQR5_ARTAN|nr:peroxisomal membrane 22 kDa (Mpv17/PMP22) family protein [Artemisia annua]